MSSLATGISTDHLFEEALASIEPMWELRGVVRGLLADGHDRTALIDDLEQFRIALQTAGRQHAEGIVLDVMGFVVGWCSPHLKM